MPSWGGNGGKKQSQSLDFPEKNICCLQHSRIPEHSFLCHQSLKRYINIIKITQFINCRDRIWIQVYLTLKLMFLYAHFSKCVRAQSFSHVWLCDLLNCSPPGSSVHGISQQEYWSGLFPPPGDLHNPGIEPAGRFFTTEPPENSQDQ